jgi:ABC-type phosphate transport system permease subunit
LTPNVQSPQSPIIVKLVETPHSELSGLADVLIGSLGLTGALTLLALGLGILAGAVLFFVRSRHPLS